MRKLAFFVEGQTEQIFVQSLVEFCARECNLIIETHRGNLGKKYERIYIEIDAKKIGTGEDYFVLIIDSGGDESVVSDIKERFEYLDRENYTMILALRDVRPKFSRDEIDKLQRGMNSAIASLIGIPIELYLSIMEIESWFLAENTHFQRIDLDLNRTRIMEEVGFFPDNQNAENRDIPSRDLNDIYNIVGKQYDKGRSVVMEVINALNFSDIVKIHSLEIENLGGVVNGLNVFFRHNEV